MALLLLLLLLLLLGLQKLQLLQKAAGCRAQQQAGASTQVSAELLPQLFAAKCKQRVLIRSKSTVICETK
jgi:hypothetical protein